MWLVISLAIVAIGLAALDVRTHPGLPMRSLADLLPEAAAVAIFAMTYLVLAIGRLPGFWLDLVTQLRRNPVPYLLRIPMSSNIGKVDEGRLDIDALRVFPGRLRDAEGV